MSSEQKEKHLHVCVYYKILHLFFIIDVLDTATIVLNFTEYRQEDDMPGVHH